MKRIIFTLFLASLLLCSCKDEKKEQISETVQAFMGKQLVIPTKSLQAKIMGRDTLCPDMLSDRTKILVYVDSSGCSPCKMELAAWSLRLQELEAEKLDIPLVFIVYNKDYSELEKSLKNSFFHHPIFYDRENRADSLNHFPKKERYKTFLLDRENKVVLVGSPANNDKLWELYLRQIKKLSE